MYHNEIIQLYAISFARMYFMMAQFSTPPSASVIYPLVVAWTLIVILWRLSWGWGSEFAILRTFWGLVSGVGTLLLAGLGLTGRPGT
jgi:hypothetical protein